jgi:hypothetical protein
MGNMNTDEQKRLFKDWLQNSRKISQSTLIAYTEDILFKLKEIITLSNNEKVKSLNPNMYAYQTKTEFDYFVNIIKSDPNFDIINKTGQAQSGWVSTPLNHYGKFLVQNGNDTVNFTWIPFYKEFANKLLEYQNNRPELINKIKDIFLRMSNLTLPTLERDNNIIDIDPFTVFGLFNKGITNNNRLELISLVKESFNINADIPKDFNGIPVLNNQKSTFYYFIGDRSDNDINNLWELFKVALDYEKNSLPILEANFDNIFNTVKGQQGVKWNITMGLFWISPYVFINLDSKNRTVLQKESFILGVIKQKLKVFGNNLPTGKDYLDFCKQLRSELANNKNGINDFPAFSFYADRTINYTINDDDFNDKEIDKMNIPLNQILYGPPGTGKTYNTVLKAMSIIYNTEYKDVSEEQYSTLKTRFDELKQAGQIEFITFHQSYSYEEFVEGIKPDLDTEFWNEPVDKLTYKGTNGVFKAIANRALFDRLNIKTGQQDAILDFKNLKELFIEEYSVGAIFKTGTKNAEFRIDKYTKDSARITPINGKYTYSITFKYLEEAYNKKMSSQSEIATINGVASGLSCYYYAIYEKLLDIKKSNDNNQVKFNISEISDEDKLQLVKDYYEGKIEINNGKKGKPYVLIIDEINRGNISKIFGELITLIEEDKRENLSVKLPYSQETFTVPKNLYIIGTMNTSDRSIASIDIALRRRFKFVEMMPKKELVADFGINFAGVFEYLNTKIKILLDRDHQIGHSYFIKTKYENAGIDELKTIWFSEILPLLNEYFYCDWEKLKLIVPGFIKPLEVPPALNSECDDSIYEFKTYDEISDFEKALKQEKFEQV